MNTLSFLIKPASGLCNMRCGYCFYADEIAARKFGNTDIMSFDTVDILISEAFSSLGSQGRVSFAFQGGEPTLAGLSYFRYFVSKVSSGVAPSEMNPILPRSSSAKLWYSKGRHR